MSYPAGTAAAAGLRSCHICLTLADHHQPHCELCGAALALRRPHSLQASTALLVTACVLYFPANILPIMQTTQLGREVDNTIVSGVITLWEHGSFLIAGIIFVASVVVPVLKIMALGWLNWLTYRHRFIRHDQAKRIYEVTELVGKWSMVDVFVVALLVALIQLGNLMAIKPGSAALAFAGVVIFSMLSARVFDARLLWDKQFWLEEGHEDNEEENKEKFKEENKAGHTAAVWVNDE